jgi:mono/diheme cytochrome c family protein
LSSASRPQARGLASGAGYRKLRCFLLLGLVPLVGTLGCWEQWSNDWFPQMKWQPAVQAFERTQHEGQVDPFLPPEGALPVDGIPHIDPNDDAAADALLNPRTLSLDSLENGRQQYEIFCATCHGSSGLGDGPVSMTSSLRGPFVGVLPIAGPASIARARSDGHVYTTIRYGRRRMPSYRRIPSDDRWDIVNYIRYLNGQKGVTP